MLRHGLGFDFHASISLNLLNNVKRLNCLLLADS
jgi:hypothetical protein